MTSLDRALDLLSTKLADPGSEGVVSRRYGVVSAIYSDRTVDVVLSTTGVTLPAVSVIAGFQPRPGDLVAVDLAGSQDRGERSALVLGAVQQGLKSVEAIHAIGAAGEPAFAGGWVNYGGAYAPAGYWKDPEGFVWLRGLIKLGTIGSAAFTLPVGYRPPELYHFGVNANGFGIADVYPGGNVVPGFGSNAFHSLSGLCFPTDVSRWHIVGAAGEPGFLNGWVTYGSTYGPIGFYKDTNGFVHLKGLAKNGTVGTAIFTLPVGYRPPYKHIYMTTGWNGATDIAVRVDVYPDGTVVLTNAVAGTANGYVSLDGLVIPTTKAHYKPLPTYNGWVPYSLRHDEQWAPPSYFIDSYDIAHTFGLVENGTLNVVAAITMAPSYDATDNVVRAIYNGNGMGRFDHDAGGQLEMTAPGTLMSSLDNGLTRVRVDG